MERSPNRGLVAVLLLAIALTVAGLAIYRSFWIDPSRVAELACPIHLGGERAVTRPGHPLKKASSPWIVTDSNGTVPVRPDKTTSTLALSVVTEVSR